MQENNNEEFNKRRKMLGEVRYIQKLIELEYNLSQKKDSIAKVEQEISDYEKKLNTNRENTSNIKQIQEVLLQGAEAVTISPELIETSIWHPYTDKSVLDFEIYWKNKFGDKKIIDMI